MEPNEVMTDEQMDALIDSFEGGAVDEPGVTPEEILAEDGVLPEENQQDDASDQQEEEQSESGEEQADDGKGGKPEPGYVKGRIEKAVSKAVAQANAEWQAKFDAVLKPLQEKMIEDEAQELVRSRKVADIETARELVRYRKGQPSQQSSAPQEQPRQANGQFAAKEDPVISARIEILGHQADRIMEKDGLDVMAEFNKNAEIKRAVLNGEMDFYEVAEQMKARPARKRPPSPTRSPNGVNGQINNPIMQMSDEQFDRFVERVRKG